MGFLDFIGLQRIPNVEIKESKDNTSSDWVGDIDIPAKLKNSNAFILSNSVAEINFPIDFLADRASKLRYYIADKNGDEVENTELNRFITNINPFYSFSDTVYQYISSYLGDGNVHKYVGVPSLYKKVSVNSIERLDILRPQFIQLYEYSNISTLNVSNIASLLKKVIYSDLGIGLEELSLDKYSLASIDANKRTNSRLLAISPLFKSERNINNLLATYSARYNVYANNGSAGYLVKKPTPANDIQAAVNPADRDAILKDINKRNGITGKRNFWGISSVPIEFINTLATIKDLMPFDETLANAIQIAATFQIPSTLVPRVDQSKYNNLEQGETSVWENALISLVEAMRMDLTKTLMLNKVGYSIKADYSRVTALNKNVEAKENEIGKRLENLKLIKEISPERSTEIDSEITKILQEYGTKQ